jgi:hypothetical protein
MMGDIVLGVISWVTLARSCYDERHWHERDTMGDVNSSVSVQ